MVLKIRCKKCGDVIVFTDGVKYVLCKSCIYQNKIKYDINLKPLNTLRLNCSHCDYVWDFKGVGLSYYTSCPSCKGHINIKNSIRYY